MSKAYIKNLEVQGSPYVNCEVVFYTESPGVPPRPVPGPGEPPVIGGGPIYPPEVTPPIVFPGLPPGMYPPNWPGPRPPIGGGGPGGPVDPGYSPPWAQVPEVPPGGGGNLPGGTAATIRAWPTGENAPVPPEVNDDWEDVLVYAADSPYPSAGKVGPRIQHLPAKK